MTLTKIGGDNLIWSVVLDTSGIYCVDVLICSFCDSTSKLGDENDILFLLDVMKLAELEWLCLLICCIQ